MPPLYLSFQVDENEVVHFDQGQKAATAPNITRVHVVYMNHLGEDLVLFLALKLRLFLPFMFESVVAELSF